MTENDIQERVDEIVRGMLQDNEFLYDATWYAINDLQELLNARGIDNKLNAINDLKDALEGYYNNDTIRQKAIMQLQIEAFPNEMDKY